MTLLTTISEHLTGTTQGTKALFGLNVGDGGVHRGGEGMVVQARSMGHSHFVRVENKGDLNWNGGWGVSHITHPTVTHFLHL